jgi:hypothetical protein
MVANALGVAERRVERRGQIHDELVVRLGHCVADHRDGDGLARDARREGQGTVCEA